MKIVIGNHQLATDYRNLILNDTVHVNQENRMFTTISSIEGLETAPFRNGTGDWSGIDGGYMSSQLFSARTITISGAYIDRQAGCDFSDSSSTPFHHLARIYIRSRLPIRTKQYIRIFLDSGITFYTEGYCVDVKMTMDYIGYGEYQITMYCPDPALYRGDPDGTLGSEWQTATLRKFFNTGYESSKMTADGVKYATMENIDGNNHGIVWHAGGRSTPVMYTGDYPYYPQFIIAPTGEERVTNPSFYSLTTGKFFGIGYPDSDVAKFQVAAVDSRGSIMRVEILNPGAYDTDYSAKGILLKSYKYFNDGTRKEFGAGCYLDLTASKNKDGMWEFVTAKISDPGENYQVGDIICPQILGATVMQIYPGQTLIIDMMERTATLNGDSVTYYITPGSEWFTLKELTNNNLVFASSGENDAEQAKVRWRNGFLGI